MERIWAAPQFIGKLPARSDPLGLGERRSVRLQKADPKTGKKSLSRSAIGSWPPAALHKKLGPFEIHYRPELSPGRARRLLALDSTFA